VLEYGKRSPLSRSLAIIIISYAIPVFIVGCTGDQASHITPTAEVQNTIVAVTPIPPMIPTTEATPTIESAKHPVPTSTAIPVTTATEIPTQIPTKTPIQTPVPTVQTFVQWSNWETGEWAPSSTPPDCGPLEDIFGFFPIDVNVVDEFTPPGRAGGNGGYYVSHGHLRSQKTPYNQIDVKFPAKGFSLYAVSRRVEDYYIETKHIVDDEEQVKLEFHHPCGIKIMVDHLAQVTDRWAEIIKTVPVLKNDSRVTFMPSGRYFVDPGEVLAHAIGHATNTYLDFGVYDLRNKNDLAEMIARDWPEYVSGASHAICWTGLFGPETRKLLRDKAVSYGDVCKISIPDPPATPSFP